MSTTYAIVIEKAPNNYGAYVPDLPGCVAVGDTVPEVLALIAEAIELHLAGMREDGEPIPKPTTVAVNLSTHFATIGSKGGRAAAARLTPRQRSLRAAAAGRAGGRGRPQGQGPKGAASLPHEKPGRTKGKR
jgi:predicted RNase H-like HicB family nuclease